MYTKVQCLWSQKREADPLEQKSRTVVNCLIWVRESQFCARLLSHAFSHRPLVFAPQMSNTVWGERILYPKPLHTGKSKYKEMFLY